MLGVSWCTILANLFPSDCWVFPGALSLQISSPLIAGCFLVHALFLPISSPLLSGCFLVHHPCKSLPLWLLGVSWCTLLANFFPYDCWGFPGACSFLANLFPFAFWVFPGTLSLQISSPLLSGCFLVAPPLPISFPLLSGCFLVHYPCKSLPLSRFSDSGLTAPLVPDCLVPLSPLHGAHPTIHFALQCTHWNRHTCTLAHCLLCARQRGLKRTPWLYCTVQSFLDTFT